MEEVRYFYSRDGTDALGPVTHEEFCQLIQDNAIGADSFYCHEGETEWRPLDPEAFVRPAGTTRLPPYEPPPYVPPPDAKERNEERLAQLQEGWDDPGPYPVALLWAGWSIPVLASVVIQFLRHWKGGGYGFLAALVFVGFVPFLISRPFKRVWRRRVCVIGIVLLAVCFIAVFRFPAAETPATPAAGSSPTDAGK